jgi:hypothetical protein
MDKNHTATAHYVVQYYLMVISSYGIPRGEGWYDAGSTVYAMLDIGILDYGNRTRRVFTDWSVDASGTDYAQSDSITMDIPKTAIANWETQFYLTVRTNPSGLATFPTEGWYDRFANVTVHAPSVSSYVFQDWHVDGVPEGSGTDSVSVYMDAPHTVTAQYSQTMLYTLTISATSGGTTDPAPGTYHAVSGSIINVTAHPNDGYVFARWERDNLDAGSASLFSVVMDRNQTLKAVFSLVPASWFIPVELYWFLLPLLILLVVLLVLIFARRRRKNAKKSFNSGWTAWYYSRNLPN